MNKKELKILVAIYEAYCNIMSDEFDFPGSKWTPDRDDPPDEAARNARALIDAHGGGK